MCPIPLITFNWSTIRLSFGTSFGKHCLDYHGLQSLCLPPFPSICYLQSQLHGTKYRISPICRSSHALLYSRPSHSLGPSGGANLLWTWLLHSVGKKQTLSIPGRGCAALMCHAICMDWLMVALSSTPSCLHEQSPRGNACQCSHYPLNGRWGYCARIAGALWNTPIICSIVCHQLQVKYTFLYIIGWTFLILFTLTLLSPQDDRRHTQKDGQQRETHHQSKLCKRLTQTCSILSHFWDFFLNIFAFTPSSLWHYCLNVQNPFI